MVSEKYLLQTNSFPSTRLDMKHQPHDTRHTCTSMLAEAHVDPTMIKKIVGHSGAMTLTERVYTHLDIEVLVAEINKIC